MARVEDVDINLSIDGRVMEVLSEHLCEGWLEGYLLTGRHGFFSCYEAFAHVIDSMFNQHAKWLKTTKTIPWRKPIASLNYLLTSHVWRQDHNGFSHQDPGFIDHVASKKADIVRIYLPPDANCLLSVTDHCLRSRNYVNLIIAGKQPEWQWLDIESAVRHCTVGAGIWQWASNDAGDPDVVMACAGDVPTLETLAAVTLLRDYVPDIRIRVVNVVDLMALQPPSQHPHGLEDQDFDALFTRDKPVIFAFHGYPRMIHWLTYRRHNHDNFHVRGFKEEGTTTTPFRHGRVEQPRPLPAGARRHQPDSKAPATQASRDRPLLEHDGASQALRQRARRGYARGTELALDLAGAHDERRAACVVRQRSRVQAAGDGQPWRDRGIWAVPKEIQQYGTVRQFSLGLSATRRAIMADLAVPTEACRSQSPAGRRCSHHLSAPPTATASRRARTSDHICAVRRANP